MLVSVIIPCYNVEDYIKECIDSVYNQTHKNIEVICIDNNSTDKTWNVLLKLKEKYEKLIIEKELKAGANAARNKGITLSKGEWIQFLDADDLLEPQKIEYQLQLINASNQNIDFIAAASKKRSSKKEFTTIPGLKTDPLIAAFVNQTGNTCANLWKKVALTGVGNWNEEIKSSQETELMLRFAQHQKKFVIDVNPYTIIRERESGQISQGNPEKKWQQYLDIRINYLHKLKADYPEVYSVNKGYLFDYLMVSVLILSKYNKQMALNYYDNTIKNEWQSSNSFGFGKFKVFLINFLGFKNFIQLSSLINK